MTAIVSQPENLQPYITTNHKQTLVSRFAQWATEEERHHIAWVGISITAMSAMFFPATMFVILLNGMAFLPMLMAMISLATVVVVNLAAMPTKYTIPFFALGILVDVLAVVVSFYIK